METMGMEQLVSIFFLLFNLVDVTRMTWMTKIIYFPFRCRKNHSFFSQIVSLTDQSDSFVSDGRYKQHFAPRASITCHTRNVSRRVHVTQNDRDILLNAVCVFLKSHFISSMFQRNLTWPTVVLTFLHVLCHTCIWFVSYILHLDSYIL